MSASAPLFPNGGLEKRYEDIPPVGSDADSDFEDDPVVWHARNSTEVAQHDQKVLDEEEEREELLAGGTAKEASQGFFGRRRRDEQSGAIKTRNETKRSRRSRKKRKEHEGVARDEQGELMYEMEEGGAGDDSSQASASSAELDKFNLAQSSMSKAGLILVTENAKLIPFTAPEVSHLARRCHIHCRPLRSTYVRRLHSLTKNRVKSSPLSQIQRYIHLRSYNHPHIP